MKKTKDIGDLVKNRLQEAGADNAFDAELEWFFVKPKVKKLNFFKWGFGHLNIYYSLAALALLLSCVVSVYTHSETEGTKVKESAAMPQEAEGTESLTTEAEPNISPKTKEPTNYASKVLAGKPDTTEAIENTSLPITAAQQENTPPASTTTKDSLLSSLEDLKAAPKEFVIDKKPVVTISRNDTITKIDTLRKVKTKKVFR